MKPFYHAVVALACAAQIGNAQAATPAEVQAAKQRVTNFIQRVTGSQLPEQFKFNFTQPANGFLGNLSQSNVQQSWLPSIDQNLASLSASFDQVAALIAPRQNLINSINVYVGWVRNSQLDPQIWKPYFLGPTGQMLTVLNTQLPTQQMLTATQNQLNTMGQTFNDQVSADRTRLNLIPQYKQFATTLQNSKLAAQDKSYFLGEVNTVLRFLSQPGMRLSEANNAAKRLTQLIQGYDQALRNVH